MLARRLRYATSDWRPGEEILPILVRKAAIVYASQPRACARVSITVGERFSIPDRTCARWYREGFSEYWGCLPMIDSGSTPCGHRGTPALARAFGLKMG
jgi:hypothetical protein